VRALERGHLLVASVPVEEPQKHRPHTGAPEVACIVRVGEHEILRWRPVETKSLGGHLDGHRRKVSRHARQVGAFAVDADERPRGDMPCEPCLRRIAGIQDQTEVHRGAVDEYDGQAPGDGEPANAAGARPKRRTTDPCEHRADEHDWQHEAWKHVQNGPDERHEIGERGRDEPRHPTPRSGPDHGQPEQRQEDDGWRRRLDDQPRDVSRQLEVTGERGGIHLIRARAVVRDVVDMCQPAAEIDQDIGGDEIRDDRCHGTRQEAPITHARMRDQQRDRQEEE